jgi:hypothetical protein
MNDGALISCFLAPSDQSAEVLKGSITAMAVHRPRGPSLHLTQSGGGSKLPVGLKEETML